MNLCELRVELAVQYCVFCADNRGRYGPLSHEPVARSCLQHGRPTLDAEQEVSTASSMAAENLLFLRVLFRDH